MVRFECPFCGQVMQTAQYLNGKGHCLKCDAVVAETTKHPLNPEWTRKMRAKFDALNTDGKVNKNGMGTLDFEELSALLLKGNPNFTDEELQKLFQGADSNGNGVIEFTEFLWFLYGQSSSMQGAGPKGKAAPGNVPKMEGQGSRAAGECSKFKLNPSDACESDSGVCPKNNGGPHHFKYGACMFCHIGEGKLVKGEGTFAYSGGKGQCEKGGKCMYQFGKCKKCNAKEF